MWMIRFCFAGGLLALCATAHAGDIVRTVPADGAWVRFHMHETWSDADVGNIDRTIYLTIKSVGTKIVNDKPCRWIESKIQSDEQLMTGTGMIFKVLVPEKELTIGDPVNGAVESWWRRPNHEVAKVPDLKGHPRLWLFFLPALSGRVREPLKLEERQAVVWQQGQLDCRVMEGNIAETLTDVRWDVQWKGRGRLALHETVPFGVAAVRFEIEKDDRGTTGSITGSLTDNGAGAVSDLPEIQ